MTNLSDLVKNCMQSMYMSFEYSANLRKHWNSSVTKIHLMKIFLSFLDILVNQARLQSRLHRRSNSLWCSQRTAQWNRGQNWAYWRNWQGHQGCSRRCQGYYIFFIIAQISASKKLHILKSKVEKTRKNSFSKLKERKRKSGNIIF